MGLDTLDTAIVYGESEQRLGEIGVERWRIISKLPAIPDSCTDISGWVKKSISDSLERLKVSHLCGLLLHHPQQLLGEDGYALYKALEGLKHLGVVEKIGISIYDPQELEALTSRYRFDLVQAPFNVLDRRMVTTTWLPKLKQFGTEVHVRSVFLQGLLLMDATDRPAHFQKWQPLWDTWHEWLIEKGLSPLQASLGFVLAHADIDRVIVGVDSLPQLQELLSIVKVTPPPPVELNCEDTDLINPSRWT
jgi:aryl-alcohol dehydrogenase-like predicted oxidoreductase